MKSSHYTVSSRDEAWTKANELFPTDYEQDTQSSSRAGYPIYRSTADGMTNYWYNTICDLGCRLEINLCGENWDGETINVWIEEPAEEKEDPQEPENWEARKELGRRIQRLMYYYTIEYMDEMENKEREADAIKAMEADSSSEVKCMVLTAEWNAKVMMDCMKECRQAVKILACKDEDVDDWMIAGIDAAITAATKDHTIPFDLPTCINGMLGAEYRTCVKKWREEKK